MAKSMYRVEIQTDVSEPRMPSYTHRAVMRGTDDRLILSRLGMSADEALMLLGQAVVGRYPRNAPMREAVREAAAEAA